MKVNSNNEEGEFVRSYTLDEEEATALGEFLTSRASWMGTLTLHATPNQITISAPTPASYRARMGEDSGPVAGIQLAISEIKRKS
jgi:hypothetical protein